MAPVVPVVLAKTALRAAAYVRVSTSRQAERETSLADQVGAITSFCEARGIELAEVYREPGASATDDNRPQFRTMVEAATSRERPYDLVIVHSFSRFFRDQFEFERYRRKLAKAKVELVSITQDVGGRSNRDLVRSILSKFDEYQSAENAKHVRRSMLANAQQGFWNGSRPPLGYKVVVAERRGDKDRKVLAVDELEAPLVWRIFSLYLDGDGATGPLGIKKIVSWLNGADTAIEASLSTSRTSTRSCAAPPTWARTTSTRRTPAPVSDGRVSSGWPWKCRPSSTKMISRQFRRGWPSATRGARRLAWSPDPRC